MGKKGCGAFRMSWFSALISHNNMWLDPHLGHSHCTHHCVLKLTAHTVVIFCVFTEHTASSLATPVPQQHNHMAEIQCIRTLVGLHNPMFKPSIRPEMCHGWWIFSENYWSAAKPSPVFTEEKRKYVGNKASLMLEVRGEQSDRSELRERRNSNSNNDLLQARFTEERLWRTCQAVKQMGNSSNRRSRQSANRKLRLQATKAPKPDNRKLENRCLSISAAMVGQKKQAIMSTWTKTSEKRFQYSRLVLRQRFQGLGFIFFF